MKDITGSVEISGTVDTNGARQVGLDQEGIGMLMSILTNQYTDKHLAVLREYFCNGWDAHIQAGRTDQPVLVTLPSDMQPSLLIQDKGIGLAEPEMIDIFGTYGKSTKRETNEQTGAFGIGSKSAWTMGQQFVVTGVKDGVKTVALFALNSEGVGTCTIMHSSQTDEENGVLISLAVPDVEAMNEAAAEFFETVDRGTVLVNGQEPTPVWETLRQINDQTWVRPDHKGKVYLVMGQVSYLVESNVLRLVHKALADTEAVDLAASLTQWGSDGTSIYFKVPLGAVTVHPSRERLRDTNHTVNTLSSLVAGLSQDMTTSVQEEIEEQPSLYQAALAVERAVSSLGAFRVSRKTLTYKGQKIPNTAKVDLPTFFLTSKSYRYNAAKIVGREDYKNITAQQAGRTLTITGVPKGEETKVSRYLKRYLENTARTVEWVFVTDQPWGAHDWFAFGTETGAETLTLEEFRAELREMRESNPRTKAEPSYTTGHNEQASRDLNDRDLLSDIISWGKDIIVTHDRSRFTGTAAAVLKDYTVVVLLAQQSEAMLRKRVEEDGSVKVIDTSEAYALVKAHAQAQFDAVTDDEKTALAAREWLRVNTDYSHKAWVESLVNALGEDYANVDCPALQEVIDTLETVRLVAADVNDERAREIANLAEAVRQSVDYDSLEIEFPSESELFPLLGPVSYYTLRNNEALRADVVRYLNGRR